jgi:hypothetical protein
VDIIRFLQGAYSQKFLLDRQCKHACSSRTTIFNGFYAMTAEKKVTKKRCTVSKGSHENFPFCETRQIFMCMGHPSQRHLTQLH